jgi:uroporphyrinogen III methyltransferase/synthase
VIKAPLIELAPPPEPERLCERLGELLSALLGDREAPHLAQGGAEWLIFTSVNAVNATLTALERAAQQAQHTQQEHPPERLLAVLVERGLKIACVGKKTSTRLERLGVPVAITPERYVAEGLMEALEAYELRGAKVLFPRALKAREWLPEQLKSRGALLDLIPAYQTLERPLNHTQRLRLSAPPSPERPLRFLTFTADSTARSLLSDLNAHFSTPLRPFEWAEVCVIGPVVARFFEERGVRVSALATPHTTEGLTQALIELARDR